MLINLYRWSETDAATKAKILRRAEEDIKDVAALVAPIIEDVRLNGDAALIKYAKKFDKVSVESFDIKASEEEFARARKNIDPALKDAIQKCAANVRRFHEAQYNRLTQRWFEEIQPGVWGGEQISPLSSVGIYVPRGKGAFPSVVYMLGIPAMVAQVPNISLCTPPTSDGSVDDVSLFAAEICGIKNVYKAGGAGAIAALAYGTTTILRADKVIGPGNAYVSAGRRLLADLIDPGMPAGPTDALIIADDCADPHNTALDLLNEAEHGSDSASILVTWSPKLADAVRKLVPDLIDALPAQQRDFCATVMSNYGGIVVVESQQEAIAFCNAYAPEHVMVKVANPREIVPQIKTAGEILIGENTPMVLGNFGIGVNNVLPSGGRARTWSATTVRDFIRISTLAWCNSLGYSSLAGPVATLATYEGFPAHANALQKRQPAVIKEITPPVTVTDKV